MPRTFGCIAMGSAVLFIYYSVVCLLQHRTAYNGGGDQHLFLGTPADDTPPHSVGIQVH